MTQPPTSTELSQEKIIDLVEKYNLSICQIFEQTDYTPERAYPEVVALVLSLGIALQIATAYGKTDHVRALENKIVEIYADWIEVSGGKMPICNIEKDKVAFSKAIEELKTRISKQS